jgi:ribosomal protein L32
MKGPLQLIRRRSVQHPAQQADDPQPTTEAPTQAASEADGPAGTTPATTQSGSVPPPTEGDAPEAEPAGQEPPTGKPSFRHRGRMRRRLRYLRRVRELGFRDLGGLVFDQHKFSQPNTDLVGAKLGALGAVDAELRALEHALDDRRSVTELREPGISVCPRCGALHGSDAHFCPSCGAPFQGPRAIAGIGEGVSTTVGEIGTVEPTPPGQIGPPAPEPYATEPLWAQPWPRPEHGEQGTTFHQAGESEPPTEVHQPAQDDPATDVGQAAGEGPRDTETSANGDAAGRSEPAAGERSET